MTVNELLEQFRKAFDNERDKGTAFEELMVNYLMLEPVYSSQLETVWMWRDFPYRDAIGDIGIDLVAKTNENDYWAIQCKFYDDNTTISKKDIDSFLSASSKAFFINESITYFSNRFIISTTDKYGKNAEATLEHQNPSVVRIGLEDLLESSIDWNEFAINKKIKLKNKYSPRPHQEEAIKNVLNGFKTHDRGKLIMACGTGKTFTSLRLVEKLLNSQGNVLFFVPSIALVNQTLTEWSAQAQEEFNALVVCSDNKVGKGDDLVDLKVPSTTDIERLKKWVEYTKNNKRRMNFIFSTYQSIDMVHQMQKSTDIHFDIIICDEAHRTTGVTLANEDESAFKRVHDNDYIEADKRLYMTATPRIFGDAVKGKAKEASATLASMDDENIFGPEFHNLTFSEAVKLGLLTDYKVLILAVDEEYVKKELQGLLTDENHEISLDDSVKIMGCWKGLSKLSVEKNNESFESDPLPMKRAVAFCNQIKDSKGLVNSFNAIQEHILETPGSDSEGLVDVKLQHVDGTFNALEKKNCINWLKENSDENECRILTNARCLSEGVDVPALDAVIFLNPRSSIVDIIQSVGRVMRKSEGKKYGYVLLPVGISANEDADEALEKNKKYQIIWSVLQALRAHDDRFNNTINKIDLNRKKPNQIGIVGIGSNKTEDDDNGYNAQNKNEEMSFHQVSMSFEELDKWKDSIYAKMVKKVGSRRYWESWAKDVAGIAQRHIERIEMLLNKNNTEIDTVFHDFVYGLRMNLNSSITEKEAIQMLAQHLITKPVFDALFDEYEFVKNNPVSQTMQKMMDILDKQALDEEKSTLNKFYESVRERAAGIDNSEGKQKIILELYEKFFKTALPLEVEKLGIVYTPSQCVDFIINSVENLLNKEFGKSLSDKGVHIIDGFTGTGTFIVQLLRSGIIKKENLLYKYTNDIHANEIILLAYYIAAINIEETFHELSDSKEYVPFEGIVLTDTFQLYEDWKEDDFTKAINEEILPRNSLRAKNQRSLPITVCIGNPPYSVGQKSSNDNAQNLKYFKLDSRIADTYVKETKVNNKNSLYDSYIKAFRWASDRINDKGVIGFITNGSFIDNLAMSGFRKCIFEEFTSVYIFNLRGNQRTSGEQSRREGGKIFGSGSRTPVAITCLIKNPDRENDGFVHYYDIGDYLTREQKLSIIKDKKDISNIDWKKIIPDENNDWINKKSAQYVKFPILTPEKKFDLKSKSYFNLNSMGIGTSRDAWVYNFNKCELKDNMNRSVMYYNSMLQNYREALKDDLNTNFKKYLVLDPTKISWSSSLDSYFKSAKEINYQPNRVVEATYRPFCKQYLYYGERMIHRRSQQEQIYLNNEKVPSICVSSSKGFTALMLDSYSDLHIVGDTQVYPLYWYKEEPREGMFASDEITMKKIDGITDYIQTQFMKKYSTEIKKEDIFYYIYGFMHSKDYLAKYETDLKKSSPRIMIVDNYSDYQVFVSIGKELADLHLNYEKIPPYTDTVININFDAPTDEKKLYYVEKMKFGKNRKTKDKGTIEYNEYIQIASIPDKAYEYTVNGKSAIEWIMESYQIKSDKKSGIINNPNEWCNSINNPKYIFDLLLSIINMSIKTMKLIELLPKLNFDE